MRMGMMVIVAAVASVCAGGAASAWQYGGVGLGGYAGIAGNDSARMHAVEASMRGRVAHTDPFYGPDGTLELSNADRKLLKRCNKLSADEVASDPDCVALASRVKAAEQKIAQH